MRFLPDVGDPLKVAGRLFLAALVLLALPTQAGLLDYRAHVWCRVTTTSGVQLMLVIHGQPSKLNMRERGVLNQIAQTMTDMK